MSAPAGLRERGKQRRTARILDAALDLLREAPDQPLTVERIAARAEVSAATVYNLVGARDQLYSALADRALEELDLAAIRAAGPQQRARRIVAAAVRALVADAPLFRALLAGWTQSGRVFATDPTAALTDCLRELGADAAVAKLHGEVLAAGLVGAIHQWSAGLLSDRGLARRAAAVVDVVFAAAAPATAEAIATGSRIDREGRG